MENRYNLNRSTEDRSVDKPSARITSTNRRHINGSVDKPSARIIPVKPKK